MTFPAGRYRIVPARSRASVIAQAPGHRFRAHGQGVEGAVELDGDRVLALFATFPLSKLDAGDPLSNRELSKFLDLPQAPIARAELTAPFDLEPLAGARAHGRGTMRFSIGKREMSATLEIVGSPERATARFALSFTGLGYQPPKLLFLKVKDPLEVEVEVVLAL